MTCFEVSTRPKFLEQIRNQLMRRTIPITTKPRNGDRPPEIRLFTMSDRQAALFARVASALTKSVTRPLTQEQAEGLVEKTIANMLGGQMPPETAPRAFHELRIHFPILKPPQIRKLLRFGCPAGRIEAMVITFACQGVGLRQCFCEFDTDQADAFNDAIEELTNDAENYDHETGEPTLIDHRDSAWVQICSFTGRLLSGAELNKPAADEPERPFFLLRLVGLFQSLTSEERAELPLATEDQLRRWSFRADKSR